MNINEQLSSIQTILKNNDLVTKDGELIELHDKTIEEISKTILKAEGKSKAENNQKAIEGIKIKQEIDDFEKLIKDTFGQFYFNFYNNIPKELDRQFKFRFIFLCTYLKYNDDRLVKKEDNGRYRLIKEYELQELLKLKKVEYQKTKKVLLENNLISIDKNSKAIHINNKISLNGNIHNKNQTDYVRIFKTSIRELYNSSSPREHKKIDIIIELLPYIHFQYNILCKNPTCELMEDIIPLTVRESMEELKMTNITAFKKSLLSIKANNKKVIMIFEDFDKQMIAINPLVYYRGTRQEALQYLIDLFKI